MQSLTLLSVLAALFSATNAVPNPSNLVHYRLHGQHVGIPVEHRSIFDGKCGGDAGPCGEGYCCSKWGYCGKSADYCGTGCQSAFGTCNIGVQDSSPSPVAQSSASSSSSSSSQAQKIHHTTFSTITASSLSAAYTPPPPAPSSTTSTSTVTPAPSSPAQAPSSNPGGSGLGDVYKMYTGDGTVGWPALSDWMNFESLWSVNLPIMKASCSTWNVPNNSDQENEQMKSAIQQVASSSGVDERFILAIVMQESGGCVRVHTTTYSHANPGLMQSHEGSGTCNIGGSVSTPCPESSILQMIKDGTTGTASGDGLQQLLSQQGASGALSFYKAARCYNSGSIAPGGDLGQGVATHCYASDVANRLTGWSHAASSCNLDH